jgi:hypothetical protein
MGMCESKQEYFEHEYLTSEMNEEIQFTRYLYEKDEVKIALVTSIINKKDDAIFWAYELFYSGFKPELAELLWKIYFDFYSTLNPAFEKYLKKKLMGNFCNNSDGEKLISMIINNFIIRPHNMDVFMLRQIAKTCDFDKQYLVGYKCVTNFNIIYKEILLALETEDYLTLSSLICNDIFDKHLLLALEKILGFFSNLGLKLNNTQILKEYQKNVDCENNPFKRIILLSKTIYYFTLIKKLPLGKNLYVHIEPEEIIIYENICVNLKEKGNGQLVPVLPAYKILPLAAIYYIDRENYLSLFKLKRDTIDIKNAYNYQWLYHASFAPIWKERIEKFHGYIDKINKTVIFNEIEDSDDNLQAFYDEFGYEPDEQKTDIQVRTIQEIIQVRDWTTFYRDHKNLGVVEIEEEILGVFDKIVY